MNGLEESHSHGHDHGHGHGHGHDHSNNGNSNKHAEADCESHNSHNDNVDTDMVQRQNVLRRLRIASVLCCLFFIVEVTGGLIAGSLAILSDAAHLFSDLAAFLVAIAASHLASLPPTAAFTFGYKRSEALAALFSMVSLAIVSIFLFVEGIRRLYPMIVSWIMGDEDVDLEVDGKVMSMVAFIGVVVNCILAVVLGEHHVHLPGGDHGHSHEHQDHHDEHNASDEVESLLESGTAQHSHKEEGYGSTPAGEKSLHLNEAPHSHDHHDHDDHSHHGHDHGKAGGKRNVNLQAAYLHVLADLAQSVAVLVAGLVIWVKPSWKAIDPVLTIVFCIVIFYSTIAVIRSSISVLLEEVPPGVEWKVVLKDISSVPGVSDVHDLHIWSISHGSVALSVHATADNPNEALKKIYDTARSHGIDHCTVQLQTKDGKNCITCGPGMLHCK
eukprot:scaffold24732_cov162-Cylindrotheca_fusiformis.AAC.4